MLIRTSKSFDASEIGEYCWSRLSKYQNVSFTASAISELHELTKKQLSNAKSQAQQIKFCLMQAKEYMRAASSVSIATKPVLLYYSVMSLALAEILMKQSGDSRLPKLREEHGCHGLAFTCSHSKDDDRLKSVSSKLIAKSQADKTGNPKGTFEVWRTSGRELPIAGAFSQSSREGLHRGVRVLIDGEDAPLSPIPSSGLSLHACLCQLPYMADTLIDLGSNLQMVRATVNAKLANTGDVETIDIIIQPSAAELIDAFNEMVTAKAETVNSFAFTYFEHGYKMSISSQDPEFEISLPGGLTMSERATFFSCSQLSFNEFGYLYVALHICGNFARYYPDIWLDHIERSSPLAMAVDELCKHAQDRLPLLTLSELSRTMYMPRN